MSAVTAALLRVETKQAANHRPQAQQLHKQWAQLGPFRPDRWPQGSSQGGLSVTITEGAASGWLHHHLPAVYQWVGVALAVGGGRVQTEGGGSALQCRAVAHSVQRRQGTVQLNPLQHARSSNSTV